MSDGDGDPAAAAGLERTLAELAPLLRRAAAQEPDPAFVRALRARLVAAPSTAPPLRQAQRGRRALDQVVLVAAALATLLALAVAVVAPELILVFLLVAAIVTIVLGVARRRRR